MAVSPAAERGREVRQRLLTAAIGLIPERGWTAVSTRVLAERAGVTPSVVHYHFPSLTALLNEAVVSLMRQALAAMEPLLDTAGSPADAIEAMFASMDQYDGTDPLSLAAIEGYLAASRDEQLREQIRTVVEQFRQRFGRWLAARGVDAPDETAAVLVAAIDGLLLHRGLAPDPDPAATAAVLRRLVTPEREQR